MEVEHRESRAMTDAELSEAVAILLSTCVVMQQLEHLDAARIIESAKRIPENKCCFCAEMFRGWGHNPYPVLVRRGAVACSECNLRIVLPQRIREGGS